MMNHVKILLSTLAASILLSACKPDSLQIELFTSDFRGILDGEVIEVPLVATFSGVGDSDEEFRQAQILASQFLPNDTVFNTYSETFGDKLMISTTIPIAIASQIDEFLDQSPYLLYGLVEDGIIYLSSTVYLDQLDKELSSVNYFLGVELPAKSTKVIFFGDDSDSLGVSANSVWVKKQPYKNYSVEINRRDRVELEFKGGDDSIYSKLPIAINFWRPSQLDTQKSLQPDSS